MLTGRWLLFVQDDPIPKRYLEFSPNGNVTCYKLDGVTLDQVPGYTASWTVEGNVIIQTSQMAGPAKPLTSIKEFVSKLVSSEDERLDRATRMAYSIEDDSTLHLELLDPRLQHRITLKRVPDRNQ
jgi:hypothetical protein